MSNRGSNAEGTTGFPDDELLHEQEFIDGLYARVDVLRGDTEASVGDALAQGSTPMQARLERDVLVAERSDLLAALNAVDGSLCFGRIDLSSGVSHHIGRIGIRAGDTDHTPILIDWRAPVARPFYLATGHTPMDLRRRRHITTDGRRVTDLHDEILDLGDHERTGHEDPTGDAVLLAALNSARTGRMSDIVQTIQAEQDRIIRAPHKGVLVVEGGPGTGKTAVALHRAAYLLYEYRELLAKRAVLIVGPNPAFLGYIGEVLPSLGETGVLLATVGELFPGVRATATDTPRAAAVKGRADMAEVLAAVVQGRQALPDPVIAIEHDRDVLMLDAGLVQVARDRTREAQLPHNVAREYFEGHILNALTDMLAERIGTDPFDGSNLLDPSDITQIRDDLAENPEVWSAIDQLWPRLTPQRLVADFLADPEDMSRTRTRPRSAARSPCPGPPPTFPSSTRPPNCSARTTASPAPSPTRNAAPRWRTRRACWTCPTPPVPTSSRTRTRRTPRSCPRTTSSTPSGWPSGTSRRTTAAPPNARRPTGRGRSATSSSTRHRNSRRWPGAC